MAIDASEGIDVPSQESIQPGSFIDDDARARTQDDNWKHRSEGMRCASCMWYVEKENGHHGFGRCRRRAPTMNGFPAVFATDWCGDHKLDENKLPEVEKKYTGRAR